MTASVWSESATIQSTANADNTLKDQLFTAIAGQVLFVLTNFQYESNTHSLLVEINGVSQYLGTDYTETSRTSITLVTPAEVGDSVVVRGYIGGTAAVAASTSAAAALASQNAAFNSAVFADARAADSNNSAIASANSAIASANFAAGLVATSTTNIIVGQGSKVFAIQAGKQFAAGQFLVATSAADHNIFLYGTVTSYAGTSLDLNVTVTGPNGSAADWVITVSGAQGPSGNSVPDFLYTTLGVV